jgi:hypothetical protein
MTRDSPEPLVAPLSDFNDCGPPPPFHHPSHYHAQHPSCQGNAPVVYAQQQHQQQPHQHQHNSGVHFHHINSHYPADIFSGSPRAAPVQADMYAGQDAIHHAVQEEHLPISSAPMGMSCFRGVTYNKGKWQASVFSHGRCAASSFFPTVSRPFLHTLKHPVLL